MDVELGVLLFCLLSSVIYRFLLRIEHPGCAGCARLPYAPPITLTGYYVPTLFAHRFTYLHKTVAVVAKTRHPRCPQRFPAVNSLSLSFSTTRSCLSINSPCTGCKDTLARVFFNLHALKYSACSAAILRPSSIASCGTRR